MASRRLRGERAMSAGVREALRARRLEKRAPTEADARPGLFPGRKAKPVAGQLDLDGDEAGR
jgi:hypothetical protein